MHWYEIVIGSVAFSGILIGILYLFRAIVVVEVLRQDQQVLDLRRAYIEAVVQLQNTERKRDWAMAELKKAIEQRCELERKIADLEAVNRVIEEGKP